MKKRYSLLIPCFCSFLINNSEAMVTCPSAASLKTAHYRENYLGFYKYALNGNLVQVYVPQNLPQTKAEADSLLQNVTHAYPLQQSGPCLYAPYAPLPNNNKVFVMWSDQPPPQNQP